MGEKRHTDARATLGALLYASPTRPLVSERDWVRLVRSVGAGNPLALHALYARTHRLVFTLLMRLAGNREAAEELMLQLYDDVWRAASGYDPVHDMVLAWIMNRARAHALAHQRLEQGSRDAERPTGAALPMDGLCPSWSLQGRLALRLAAETGGKPVVPQQPQWLEPEWKSVAPAISCKLLATDDERHMVGMLVRLEPGGEYPPHTHAGVEELHLLDGVLWIDERKLFPGDYSRAEPGTGDRRVWSETGCTCVLVTSTRDTLR